MFDWWLIRVAHQTGKLSIQEWQELTAAGHAVAIPAQSQTTWRTTVGGVVIVSTGVVTLLVRGAGVYFRVTLKAGDIAGTFCAASCQVEAKSGNATIHTFSHNEWLRTLKQTPLVTQKLLNGLAQSVINAESALVE